MDYIPITKKIKDESGRDVVVCKYYGTDVCRKIHHNECGECAMVSFIMQQLNAFEEAYCSEGDN